jgi:predicted  nucleic acid-binding Zn-ribbon protein
MADRKIGAKIVLEGENEYRNAVKSCNEQLTNMKTALQATEEHYKGNANSMEALTAKAKALSDVHQAQIEKIDKLKSALQSAKEEQTKYSDRVIELKSKLENAAQEMSKLESSTEDTTDAQFKLQDEIGRMNSELQTAENGYNTASDSVNHWQSQLNKAETDCNRTNTQIDRNKQYLDEAGNAADGCATSIDKYGKKVKDAGEKTEDAGEKTSKFGEIFKGVFTADMAKQALDSVISKLKELASEVLDAADNLMQLHDVTGMSTDQLQEFEYIGTDVGVSVDTITGSLKKLINNMDSARTGTGTAYEAFQKLGVAVTENDGSLRDSNDVFLDLLDALGNVANETERDAIAQDLLGKSATELNPLIKAGSAGMEELAKQAHDSGAVMSEETVAALDKVGDSADKAKLSIKAMVGELMAAEVTAYDEEGTRRFSRWIENFESEAERGVLAPDRLKRIFAGVGFDFNWNAYSNQEEAVKAATAAFQDYVSTLHLVSDGNNILYSATENTNEQMTLTEEEAKKLTKAQKDLSDQNSENARNAYLQAQAEAVLGQKQQESAQKSTESLDIVRQNLLDASDAYKQVHDAAGDSIEGQMGLFQDVADAAEVSVDDMISSLQSQIDYMNKYADNIKKAMERGIDEGLLQKLSDGTVQSAAYLDTLVNATDEKFNQVNNKYKESGTAAENYADTVAGAMQSVNASLSSASQEFWNYVKNLDKYNDAYQSGLHTIQGLLAGINAGKAAVGAAMGSVSDSAKKAYNNGMRIKSPSKEMEQSGRYTVEGAVQGIEASRQAMIEAMSKLADDSLEAYRRGNASLSEIDSSGADRFNASANRSSGSVVNNTVNNISQAAVAAQTTVVKTPVYLDGKVLTEVVTKIQSQQARAAGRA